MDADELVRRHGRLIYNLALRLTGDAAEASDLAQDALVRALKGLPSFRGGSAAAWVSRITANAWKNRLRERAARRTFRFFAADGEGVDSEPSTVPSSEPGPEDAAETADERGRVERALARLTPEERAALVLRELEGLSYAEIADALGVPLGTVKSRLARAREALAAELTEERTDVP